MNKSHLNNILKTLYDVLGSRNLVEEGTERFYESEDQGRLSYETVAPVTSEATPTMSHQCDHLNES